MDELCTLAGRCQGCPWIQKSLAEQKSLKLLEFVTRLDGQELPTISFVQGPTLGTRDRVDLTLKNTDGEQRVGLFDREGELVQIANCPQMSTNLKKWYEEFLTTLPSDLNLASFRLRVGPKGDRGLWIDMPNIGIRDWLQEKKWLTGLLQVAHVEIGQKRKKLIEKESGELGLLEIGEWQSLPSWFETYTSEGEVPLFGPVGGFSQPGFEVNRLLIKTILEMLPMAKGSDKWVELGAGNGNLTFPLADRGLSLTAIESEESALRGLLQSKKWCERQFPKSKWQIETKRINFQKMSEELRRSFDGAKGWLVDPPRSGLKESLGLLSEIALRPQYILYVSCFPESFSHDAKVISTYDYQVEKLSLVDQFPHSAHVESVALFSRR